MVGGTGVVVLGLEAAVAAIDVLDDRFAPVAARQIKIDVGPLVARFAQEPLEQELHADRIDRGDPEGVADRAVGRRATALDEDVVGPTMLDDVPDDQEITREVETADEIELVRDLTARPDRQGPRAVARSNAALGQLAQIPERRLTRWHRKLGEPVAEIFQRERQPHRELAGGGDRVAQITEQLGHLGAALQRALAVPQHSGGMVIAAGRLDDVVPLEPATMPGRVVVQWDKDDCAGLGIVKVDLLGLGMMSVIQDSLALVRERGGDVDLARLPPDDPAVYRSLQEADTIGVFQVESRAQMATLPRVRPERFYDLVVQVAIIRPGPIVGDMVHPYIRRRRGREPVTYPHPSLEPILRRTLGVPLFQEQLLRMAMVTAGFTATEAEELRRAFGFKRSERLMAEVETKLRAGMARQGIHGAAAEEIVHAITAFALYGFPESHASSFALLAYASAYLRVHHPAAFYAALLNNQPMGFYHPATIVKDAQRHGLRIRPIDVTRSEWLCVIEPDDIGLTVRLGLRYVRGLREAAGRALVAARLARPFDSVHDLVRRVRLERDELETLAAIGALAPFGGTRRANLWTVAVSSPGPLFEDPPREESPLSEMTEVERLAADYAGTSVTLGRHPMALRRAALRHAGVLSARELARVEDGARVQVAGSVIVRQRPGTAKGFVFLSLEDETGIANVIVTPPIFARHRLVLVAEPYLLVEGIAQRQDGVISVRAALVRGLPALGHHVPSHDFG